MRIQLLSDLHLESERVELHPIDGAELLVLAGDIDTTWRGYERFADWPTPVVVVAGNHEFDGRELNEARPAFARMCERLGFTPLECQTLDMVDARGRRVRILGTTRWSDFMLLGEREHERCLRVAAYFHRAMQARIDGAAFDASAARAQALRCQAWLEATLGAPEPPTAAALDATLVITHFAPSLRSADPRFGRQPSTAAFCNDDEGLFERVDLWLHGHVHARHDYRVGRCRVVSQARGLEKKGEVVGYDDSKLIEL